MPEHDIPKAYDPGKVEEKWYHFWEEKGYFKAEANSDTPSFSIVIPPPNVTGSLHMGHALNNTLQDILTRWRRMQGHTTLWLPGTDHAGIATQNVVEKELAREGKRRQDLGREAFIDRVWSWRKEYGGRIINQLKRLGSSCDWSRERFTMDPGLSKAVKEVFVKLYEEGYIYRGRRIINWCPRCQTALSDIEVEYETLNGHLYYLKYPIQREETSSRLPPYITVATTRPETMLGDTAVAVNPEDRRFSALIGRLARLPILGRRIPIIADSFVDPEFGTGAVKVTPAHDPNDFEIGNRHQLPGINILNPDGTLNKEAGPYQGMDRYEGRTQLLKDLTQQGLLKKTEEYQYAAGHCYRCRTVVEPYLSEQWFVRMKELAEPAIKAVEEGKTKFIPSSWERTYFEWMHNIRDWCISRQIWWGHRIPVWYCADCEATLVKRETPLRCDCGSRAIKQDEDVLDTWFSSALWPFSTMGWPDQTKDLETFYPTSVLSTGFDIIFFWVARMMMMGLKFMGDVPFKKVYIHALIRDVEGKKMSKSAGNVIDPLEVIKNYGADALRFTLAALSTQGRDILLSEDRIRGYRHFCNKVWNANRFILMNMEGFDGKQEEKEEYSSLELADRWILTRFNQVIKEVTDNLEEFKFNEAALALYNFIWHEFCDWYLEVVKIRLYGDDEDKRRVSQRLLLRLWESNIKLLHPFMPFITEEVCQSLPKAAAESLMVASWPTIEEDKLDEAAVNQMELLQAVIYTIRNIRGEMRIPPQVKARVMINTSSQNVAGIIEEHRDYCLFLAHLSSIEVGAEITKPPATAASVVRGVEAEVYMPLEGLIDLEKERDRLAKEIAAIERELDKIDRKLKNEQFRERAPVEIVAREEAKYKEAAEVRERLRRNLAAVES